MPPALKFGFDTCPLFASLLCCQEGELGYGQRRLSIGSGGIVGGDSKGTYDLGRGGRGGPGS